MFVHLSHVLDPADRAFPGEPTLDVRQDSVINPEGKPFASALLHLPNHFGTHMDGPAHFNPKGDEFNSLPIEYFGYLGEEILLVDLPDLCKPGAIVRKVHLEPYAERLDKARLLLLRSGFEKYKKLDPELYASNGPCLHPELTEWLNKMFPHLCAVGMDWLSIASSSNDLGPEAHRWLLGNYTGHIIVGIEDMSLSGLKNYPIKLVMLGPLRVKGVDSSLVCAMAQVEEP